MLGNSAILQDSGSSTDKRLETVYILLVTNRSMIKKIELWEGILKIRLKFTSERNRPQEIKMNNRDHKRNTQTKRSAEECLALQLLWVYLPQKDKQINETTTKKNEN